MAEGEAEVARRRVGESRIRWIFEVGWVVWREDFAAVIVDSRVAREGSLRGVEFGGCWRGVGCGDAWGCG